MRGRIIFVTGTDTGVGKTVLTGLLLQHLRQRGARALAMKPFCSGARDDIRKLHRLQRGELSENEITPYYFEEPLAPAAVQPRRKISLREVVARIRKVQRRCEIVIVEGIGGLMVPLNERWTLADLVGRLKCEVIVVGRNRLGTLNHTLLTVAALKKMGMTAFKVVLMEQKRRDYSARSNLRILAERLGKWRVFGVEYLAGGAGKRGGQKKSEDKMKKTLAQLVVG